MNARAEAREGVARGIVDTVFERVWTYLHGPPNVMPRAEHEALWARLRELEASAKQLAEMEAVESHREHEDGGTS